MGIEPFSRHKKCAKAAVNLLNSKQRIDVAFANISKQQLINYKIRLSVSIRCIQFLLRQGLAFLGHDESETSLNRGNFLELLKFYSWPNEEMRRVVLGNALENHKVISPKSQKDQLWCQKDIMVF